MHLQHLAELIQLEVRYQLWLRNDTGAHVKLAGETINRRYFAAVHA